MSDIVERLREGCGCNYPETTCMAEDECRDAFEAADTITRLRADIISYKIGNKDLQDHCSEITNLAAEVEQNAIDLEEYRRDVERLRAALEEIIQDSFSVYAIQVARAALSGDKQ